MGVVLCPCLVFFHFVPLHRSYVSDDSAYLLNGDDDDDDGDGDDDDDDGRFVLFLLCLFLFVSCSS